MTYIDSRQKKKQLLRSLDRDIEDTDYSMNSVNQFLKDARESIRDRDAANIVLTLEMIKCIDFCSHVTWQHLQNLKHVRRLSDDS